MSLCAAMASVGCGGGNKPKTARVRGKVTVAGQPLTAGTITFQPAKVAAGSLSRPATGAINSDGTYQLTTFEKGDGAMPGQYKVVVNTMTGGPTPEDETIKPTWAASEKYADPQTTDLTATVPESGTLDKDFDLKK